MLVHDEADALIVHDEADTLKHAHTHAGVLMLWADALSPSL